MKPIEFGDYLLIKKLAAGGMGEVFLARQEQGAGFERFVAIKRILPDLSDDDDFVKMFLDEARLAARLNHPNVVQIYDLGICGDQYYLAMEFLEGRDLRRIMGRLGTQERALPGGHAIQAIHGAADGLHYAHSLKDPFGNPLNVIHRDVSPQNIFVTFHGTIKVLDFGIAKAEARSVRTQTGGLKGKYPYLSPEQVRGETVDHRSDVFSLGTVLWEITVGRRLFKRDNDLLTLQAVLKCEVPKPSDLVKNYPPELEEVVMRTLAPNPDDRYHDCRELQEGLEAFVGQYGLVLSPQKLGAFAEGLFEDEPKTVNDILEDNEKKPTMQSLLHDEGSASYSLSSADFQPKSAPELQRGEITEPSGSVVTRDLLNGEAPLSRTSTEESGSHSSVRKQRPLSDEIAEAIAELPDASPGGEGDIGLAEMFPEFEHMPLASEEEIELPPGAKPGIVRSPIPSAPLVDQAEESSAIKARGVPEGLVPDQDDVDHDDRVKLIAAAPTMIRPIPMERPSPTPPPSRPPEPVEPELQGTDDIVQAISRAPTAVKNLAAAPLPTPEELASLQELVPEETPIPTEVTAPSDKVIVDAEALKEPSDDETSGVVVSSSGEPSAPVVDPEAEVSEITARTSRSQSLLNSLKRRPALLVGLVLMLIALPTMAIVLGSVLGGDEEPPQSEGSLSSIGIQRPNNEPEETPSSNAANTSPQPIAIPSDDAGPTVSADSTPEVPEDDASVSAIGDAFPAVSDAAPVLADTSHEPSSNPADMATLHVKTVPDRLRVTVDGERMGRSPTTLALSPGRHRINVKRGSQGIDYTTVVVLEAGQEHTERINIPRGELALQIRPYAKVYIDGRSRGLTPMPPIPLTIGRHRVRLVNEALKRTVNKTVTIRQGQRYTLSVDLSR